MLMYVFAFVDDDGAVEVVDNVNIVGVFVVVVVVFVFYLFLFFFLFLHSTIIFLLLIY